MYIKDSLTPNHPSSQGWASSVPCCFNNKISVWVRFKTRLGFIIFASIKYLHVHVFMACTLCTCIYGLVYYKVINGGCNVFMACACIYGMCMYLH